MPRDVKYGEVVIEHGNFPDPDEPVFILRAQDVMAIGTLRDYQEQAFRCGCSNEFNRSLINVLERFKKWVGTRKRPD